MTNLAYFPVSGDFRNVSDPVVSGTTSIPMVEIISGFVTFYPRLPEGFVAYVDDYDIIPTANEIQRVTLNDAESGTFTLTYSGQTTGAIAYNATSGTVQTALIALSNIGPSDVVVSGSAGGPYSVTFQGALASTNVSQLTANAASLGGPTPAVNISTTRGGVAAVNEIQVVTLTGSPSGGSFTLTYAGQTTSAVAYNASAATLQSALQALSNVGAGNIGVSGTGPYTVTFTGSLGGRNIWQMTGSNAGLSGGADVVVTTNTSGVSALNEIQAVAVADASGGTFTLTFTAQTTAAIAYNASVSAVRSALEALSNINPGDIVVSGIAGNYTVAFQGTLAGTDVTQMTGNSGSLTGITPTVGISTLTAGQASNQRPTAIAIPPRKARIWEGVVSTINTVDSATTELVSNIPQLGLLARGFEELIYDVDFTSIIYAEGSQKIQNFAFIAPTDTTAVNITDPDLERLGYLGRTQVANITGVEVGRVPDDVQLDINGDVQFYAHGLPLGDPLDLAAIGPGGLSRLSLTTTATLAHTSGVQYIYLLGSGAVPTLATAVSNTSLYYLKNVSGGSITVHCTAAETIEGSTTYVLANRESITVVSDNSNWGII